MYKGQHMEIPIYTVDAFTSVPFEGNPAAICLVEPENDISESQMLKAAAEMNLSETVFLKKKDLGGTFSKSSNFHIRWFTPTVEVSLCGHATLATAAVLFNELGNPSPSVTFDSLSGDLIVKRDGKSFVMNFPLNETISQEVKKHLKLINTIAPENCIEAVEFSPKTQKLLLRLADSMTRDDLESLQPDISNMVAADTSRNVLGVIVTLRGSEKNGCIDKEGEMFDFVSRYFAPWRGIPEDPVTGSAHTVLASYWGNVLGKKEMYARQCSKRGGNIRMRVLDSGRVDLIGQAVTVLKGSLYL